MSARIYILKEAYQDYRKEVKKEQPQELEVVSDKKTGEIFLEYESGRD
mgnify:CR=1 FL=1